MKNTDKNKKSVVIELETLQRIESEVIPVKLVTTGTLYNKNGKTYITYTESELTGLKGTTTTVKAGGSKVVIKRFGAYPGMLIFELGERHRSFYETELGELSVATVTRQITDNLNKDEPSLKIIYDMELNNSIASENEINIKIKENTHACN